MVICCFQGASPRGSPWSAGQAAVRAPTYTKLGPSGVDDGVCVRVPKTNPRSEGSVGGLAGLSTVVLMAVIY